MSAAKVLYSHLSSPFPYYIIQFKHKLVAIVPPISIMLVVAPSGDLFFSSKIFPSSFALGMVAFEAAISTGFCYTPLAIALGVLTSSAGGTPTALVKVVMLAVAA